MGSVVTALGGKRPLDPLPRHLDRTPRLCLDDERSDISRLSDASHRLVEPLQKDARFRQRSLLANLVHTLEPIEAESIAIKLLSEFGTLGGVFSATIASLSRALGNPNLAELILNARFAVEESLREHISRTAFDTRDVRIKSYLVAIMQGESEEHLHAIFLSRQRQYLRDERIASGTWDSLTIRLRPLLKRAIELNAASLVLFHNHPSGNPNPSHDDVQFTKQAIYFAQAVDVEIIDHLIVAGPAVFSMAHAGLLK